MAEPKEGWYEALQAQGDYPIFTDLLSGRIDVIDLNSASIVARLRGEGIFAGFLGNGDLVDGRMLSDGTPLFVIHRVTLDMGEG
jgi:hypothetical protein